MLRGALLRSVLLLMLMERFKRLNTFLGKRGSQWTVLESLPVDCVDDFLGYAVAIEDDEGVAFQPSV